MNAQLAIPDGANPQTILNNVQHQLTSGSSLGGVPVLSVSQISLINSSGNIITSDDDDKDKYLTLIIVLCTVIPAIMIIAVMIIVSKRHKNKYN